MIAELNEKLEEARAAYYSGHPILTDSEYDLLELQLQGLIKAQPDQAAKAPVLTTVGADIGGRIRHNYPMRSIENTYTEDALVTFYQGFLRKYYDSAQGGGAVTLGPKWDGITGSLTYREGKLALALTRGDGDAGEDITSQIMQVAAIPKVLPEMNTLNIRGELVIAQSTLDRLNVTLEAMSVKPYSSTRNFVAGTMKLKDLTEIPKREVQFRPFEVLGDTAYEQKASDSGLVRLIEIAEWGFSKPEDVEVATASDLVHILRQNLAELKRGRQEISKDGFVLKVDSMKMRTLLGLGPKFANFQVCFKPQNAKGESTLREVVWQVGRQGRLTPVGIIDPIILAGAEITRVTLNNQSWIDEIGLQIGSRVEITRSGDVIPQITGVLLD